MIRRAIGMLQGRIKPRIFALRRSALGVSALVLFAAFAVCVMASLKAHAANPPAEQALIITIPLADGRPDSDEVKRVLKLESELIKAIERSRAGEYDGDEVGVGTFTMYAYGPSADKLFDVAQPILAKYPLPSGSHVVKRYGKPGARQDRIPIDTKTTNQTN
jgi:hypothetical protein